MDSKNIQTKEEKVLSFGKLLKRVSSGEVFTKKGKDEKEEVEEKIKKHRRKRKTLRKKT